LAVDLITNLYQSREDLLREYMLARGTEKAVVMSRILELDEQIEEEKRRQKEREVERETNRETEKNSQLSR